MQSLSPEYRLHKQGPAPHLGLPYLHRLPVEGRHQSATRSGQGKQSRGVMKMVHQKQGLGWAARLSQTAKPTGLGSVPAETKPSSLSPALPPASWRAPAHSPGSADKAAMGRLTHQQVAAGDAPLCDGGLHGTDGRGRKM